MLWGGRDPGWERGGRMGMRWGGGVSRLDDCYANDLTKNVGAFCVCGGVVRETLFFHLFPRASRWNDFLYFSCNSWRIMQRKTLPGNSPSVEMRPREE